MLSTWDGACLNLTHVQGPYLTNGMHYNSCPFCGYRDNHSVSQAARLPRHWTQWGHSDSAPWPWQQQNVPCQHKGPQQRTARILLHRPQHKHTTWAPSHTHTHTPHRVRSTHSTGQPRQNVLLFSSSAPTNSQHEFIPPMAAVMVKHL